MLILFYHCFLGCSLLFVKLKIMIYPVLLLSLSFHSGIMASVCQLNFALIVTHTFGKRFLYCCIVHGRPIFSSPYLSTLTTCKPGILVWFFRVYLIFFLYNKSMSFVKILKNDLTSIVRLHIWKGMSLHLDLKSVKQTMKQIKLNPRSLSHCDQDWNWSELKPGEISATFRSRWTVQDWKCTWVTDLNPEQNPHFLEWMEKGKGRSGCKPPLPLRTTESSE